MDTPKGPDDVAWYKLGHRPGDTGSAVIAGHSNWNKGAPAVFDNINKLRPGDRLFVEDDKGVISTFVVRQSRDYNQNDDASAVFGSSDGKAHLNLITCEGAWNKVTNSYSKLLVVFADKE
jgi:sortase A